MDQLPGLNVDPRKRELLEARFMQDRVSNLYVS